MPPKGVDQQAREAMTTKIAQRLTTMLFSGQNMIDAARQIEAKCYDSAKDAMDYERKVVKRLAKAAKAKEKVKESNQLVGAKNAGPPKFGCRSMDIGGDSRGGGPAPRAG